MTRMALASAGLGRVRLCVFDAYGTLLDVHSAVATEQQALGERAGAFSELWRRRQLEYTWLRSLMRTHRDFAGVTADALDYALAVHGIDDAALRERLLAAYRRLDAYPEVQETLRRLRGMGVKTAILSNGSPEMLDAAVASAGIADLLDAVISVEEAGIFKPAPEVYALATRRFGVPAAAVAFLSSNGWDAAGAAVFGFRVLWVNRTGAPRERLPGELAGELPDLASLPDLLARAAAGSS